MISIVIPIFNEEENIDLLYQRLTEASPSWQDDYEIVLVDDGSSDRSLKMMREYAAQDHHIRVVELSRNFGHQAAISAGLNVSRGDAVVVMDGDLQDPPEELHRFFDKWREGYEVVYAIRTKRKEGLFKRISYKVFYRLLHWISEIDIPLDSGDFCVMDRKVVDTLKHNMPEQNRFVRGLRAYAGFKQVGVKYERHSRAAGEVKYTFGKLLQLALNGLFNFSVKPLKLATYLGFAISIPSFLVGIFFIAHRLIGFKFLGHYASETPGLATLVVGMFFLFGIILFILGILGEYIGRIYYEVKKRPFYIISEIHKKEGQNNTLEQEQKGTRE